MQPSSSTSMPPPAAAASASQRRPSEQERILQQYDTAMAEVLLKRDQNPPDLQYLELEYGGSLQSRTFNYSPEMVSAIGVTSNRIPKGSSNKGCNADGGPPWASVPKALEPKIVSVVGADFIQRPPVKEAPEDKESAGTGSILRKIKQEKEFSERRRTHTQALVREIEAARAEEEAEQQRKRDEELAKLGALKETVKCFTHNGLERRAISAPLPGDSDEEDQELVRRRRMAVALDKPKDPRGTRGLRLPVTRASSVTPTTTVESTVDIDANEGRDAPQRPSAFWYPKDRQRFKHRTLEELRLAEAQEALLKQGWAQSTDLGGAPKRAGKPSVTSGLPQDRKDEINRQAEEFLKAKKQRDEEARTRYNTMIARPRPSELRGTVPVSTTPFPHEEVTPLTEQVAENARTAVDVSAAAARSPEPGAAADAAAESEAPHHPHGRVYVRPFMFERPPPFKPLPVYRPELPAARVPEEIQRLEMPLDAELEARKGLRGAAPPWGRETDDDAKWARIHVNKKAKSYEVKPLTKKEVTQELRLVRDKGLQKRPRPKVSATLTPAQREFVKSIPSTGPLAAQAMQPASGLPRSGLR